LDVLIGKVARDLATLEEQLDRALEHALASGLQLPRYGDAFRPSIDVFETVDALVVRVELAGVRSEDVRLVVDGEYLQINGRRTLRREPKADRHLKMEIPDGQFERVLRLAVPYEREHVTARLENGLLTIELPRSESGARRVPVRTP
jgi:HSP20 family protein